jgi:hypothetical protein
MPFAGAKTDICRIFPHQEHSSDQNWYIPMKHFAAFANFLCVYTESKSAALVIP